MLNQIKHIYLTKSKINRQADEVDELPAGFAKIKEITMLGIGAAFKIFDSYSDMALAYFLYTGTYGANCLLETRPENVGLWCHSIPQNFFHI